MVEIYRDSLSAWRALSRVGGLEIEDRDETLVEMLRIRLDANAPNLEAALANASVDEFLSAFFISVQPFVAMFKDILAFFETAGAVQGQSQIRLSVEGDFLEYKHFEEFLTHWHKLDVLFDVPAFDRHEAFILNNIRLDLGGFEYLKGGFELGEPVNTGFVDVDEWLNAYDSGEYKPFPSSLMPEHFPAGLKDAASLVLAGLSIIRQRSFSRTEILKEHKARRYKAVNEDALHPWSIAQNETDYWLRSHVGYLASIRKLAPVELQRLSSVASKRFAKFPRRKIPGQIETKDLERLLSLPAWKKRYEAYGVWIATRIVDALADHRVAIYSDKGELKFAFGEARIADIETSVPRHSLFAEKRVPLANPLGKGRKKAVQPDFSIWESSTYANDCILVIEVKQYKKRSRRNFAHALIDYSRAHEKAHVLLVNYGPVGEEFADLPKDIAKRCQMIGPFTPETSKANEKFRELVRLHVGSPVLQSTRDSSDIVGSFIVLDVSQSMRSIIRSNLIQEYLSKTVSEDVRIALVDQKVRAVIRAHEVEQWISTNKLGKSTSLADPVSKLLSDYKKLVVITDESGIQSLQGLNLQKMKTTLDHPSRAVFAIVRSDIPM